MASVRTSAREARSSRVRNRLQGTEDSQSPSNSGLPATALHTTGSSSRGAGRLTRCHREPSITRFSGCGSGVCSCSRPARIKSSILGSEWSGNSYWRNCSSPCSRSETGRSQPPPSARSPATHRQPSLKEFARQMKSTAGMGPTDDESSTLPTSAADTRAPASDGIVPQSARCTTVPSERRRARDRALFQSCAPP